MNIYDKPHLNYEQQIELLLSRGLIINDISKAINVLRNIGYYKFNAYSKPFLETNLENKFEIGISFIDIENLMNVDIDLRNRFNKELQTFELSLKSNLAYITGITDKFIQYEPQFLSPIALKSKYQSWILKYEQDLQNAKNMDLARHMSKKYQNKYPIWIAVEFMNFGTLTKFYDLLTDNHKNEINSVYNINNRRLFTLLINNFREIRNICAHNMRLWNYKTKFIIPKVSRISGFGEEVLHVDAAISNSIYRSLVLLIYLNERLDHNNQSRVEFKEIIMRIEANKKLNLESQMGVPKNWKNLDFWMNQTN